MLIEIILAFVIAMGITYFMFELIIKIKNKNDDLLVKTLVSTDQAIIYNTLINELHKNGGDSFSCNKLKLNGNKVLYNDELITIINDYSNVGDLECRDDYESIYVKIPINVKQLSNEYDIVINYLYEGNDETPPVCTLSVDSNTKVITADVIEEESGVVYSGWNSDMTTDNGVVTASIDHTGTYTYYVRDRAGNEGNCGINVKKTNVSTYCDNGGSVSNGCTITSSFAATITGYTVTGSCVCRFPGNAGYDPTAYCDSDGNCACRGGGYPANNTCNKIANYSCSRGNLSGGRCYYISSYGSVVNSYSCSSGYSKTRDNNYCWKAVE